MEIQEIKEELKDSLQKILAYADCDKKLEEAFAKSLISYKRLSQKSSSDDAARILRHELTGLFYKLYEKVFGTFVKTGKLPVVIRMFLEFGYVDEELAGMENAVYLYQLVEQLPTNPGEGVYSLFQWLVAVYAGKKEPSRNELDMDYREYLREEKRMRRISPEEEEALLKNNLSRVNFEIRNMFISVNKITFGQPTTFCPVFSKHTVLKSLSSSLVTAEKVKAILDKIRSIDFGVFYRDTLYSNPDRGLNGLMIKTEVLPDVILLPNVGSRGVMWQEIEGRKRDTPGRLMCSMFHVEDLEKTFMELAGDFRWEMCKRIQGGRWNDLSEPSLTSEYCDYVQFFKRNRELSSDTKEKIKMQMGRARNNYRQMFVGDYVQWLRYESTGSPRLNKVVRQILAVYCPFSAAVRNKVAVNPLFKEPIEKYTIIHSKEVHKITLLCKKMETTGGVPAELAEYLRFLEG